MGVQADAATSLRTLTQTSLRDRDRTFFTAAAIATALVIVAGFAYSTYARIQLGDLRFGGPTLTTMVRLHAAVSAAWIVLLIVQARLIAANRVRLHRRLGISGGLIAAAVVILGWIVAVAAIRRGVGAGGPESMAALRFFVLPVQELVVFTILIGAALWLRKRGAHHKRLILIGTLALIPAATTRPFSPESLLGALAMFGLPEAMFLLALSFHDRRSLGRLHTATLWGGGLLLIAALSRTCVAETGVWLAFAEAVIR